MITDVGPIVQRLLQQLVLAGVPALMVVSCSGGRDTMEPGLGGSGGSSVGGSAGGRGGGWGGSSVGGSAGSSSGGSAGSSSGGSGGSSVGGSGGSSAGGSGGSNAGGSGGSNVGGSGGSIVGGSGGSIVGGSGGSSVGGSGGSSVGGSGGSVVGGVGGSIGRRPHGSVGVRCRARTETPLGRLLAQAAELEAASVPAFRRVVADLTTHDAPASLVQAARTAMVDEARHWRSTRNLARRRGGDPIRPTVGRTPASSLLEMAVDNVIEGCVRETYGALVAMHQADTAHDVDVRVLMTDIARDEMNHAALSWRIDAWAASKLGPTFQPQRNQAARAALHELSIATRIPVDETIRAQTGLPTPNVAAQLLGHTWTTLWHPAFSS